MKPYPICFKPEFKARIWGGQRLASWFETCPPNEPIGEAWVLSDHPEAQTLIANGAYANHTLEQLIQQQPEWFGNPSYRRFPLLIKVIDAEADLSVQVHPDDAYGYAHAGEQGKTECWWVLDAEPSAKLIYGHTAKTHAELKERVSRNEWAELLKSVHPRSRDFFFVPAGKLHALGKGTTVLEIQQSSDTTYRLYDYNRLDANGNPRTLHTEDALKVTQIPDQAVAEVRESFTFQGVSGEHLVKCPYFSVDVLYISTELVLDRPTLTILSVIEGQGELVSDDAAVALTRGVQVLVPLGLDRCVIRGTVSILTTTLPTGS